MADIQPQSRRKRFFTILLIGVVVIGLAVLGVHIWFVNNAKGILKNIVAAKSGGKVSLELSKLYFDFFSKELEVRTARLSSTDSVNQPATYHVTFKNLKLQVASFWPLLLQNKLVLDSIQLNDPHITVTQWRKDTAFILSKDELSIPQQMGKLYNSLLDALEGFGIRRIVINNAKLSLVNKMAPGTEPVTISDIFLDLIRTPGDGNERDEFVENKHSLSLTTSHQDIAMPGGRHRLSFKDFHLELFNQRIVLDSCTITAKATDSTSSSYEIFFNRLSLIGVDFGAMYRSNLIRADSVYCENPSFYFDLDPRDAVTKKERPDPEKIIRELVGDLDLAFVGVKDAGIHINIAGDKPRSLFNSNKDDFEMRGLRINADSSQPVLVERFDMLVRDYRLFNEDSSTAYTFDSVHFLNNKMVLNNFSVVTTANGKNINHNQRDFKIPYFELTGLDWYQLIFEQNLQAQEAVLYNPEISFTKRRSSVARKRVSLFTSLQDIDRLMTLNKVDIINGQMNLELGKGASLNLQNVDLSVYSNRALKSRDREGLRRAIDILSFSNGVIKIKDITARLKNVRYTGNDLVRAEQLKITSANNRLNADVKDVYINNLLLDESSESVIVDGLQWKSAAFEIDAVPASKSRKNGGSISLTNLSGNNTQLLFKNDKMTVSSFIQSVKLESLSKQEDAPVQVEGLVLNGRNFILNKDSLDVHAGHYLIGSTTSSYISNVRVDRLQEGDSLSFHSSRINFSPNVNAILSNDFHLYNMQVQNLVLSKSTWSSKPAKEATAKTSSFRVDRFTADEPDITINIRRNDSLSVFSLPKSEKSSLKVSDFAIRDSDVKIGVLSLNAAHATFARPGWETIGVEQGKVELDLSDIVVSSKEGKPVWSGLIQQLTLENPNSFTLGKTKNKLSFGQVTVGNVQLSSDYLSNFNQLLKYNVSAWLRTATGQYTDSVTTLKWFNAGYDYKNRILSLDSFVYHPTQPRDSVITNTPYQKDYINFHSGPVQLAGFNLEKYAQDSAMLAESITVTRPVITVYRDKLPPLRTGIVKPLPVDIIKNISLPVSVQQINLKDGMLYYTEKNARSRAEGTLILSGIQGSLSNIRNRNLQEDDSLSLVLNAYLMDSALIQLRVKESYADTLSGFLMSLRMRPTTLAFLNPVLAPLSNVVIRSGTIDSLQLRAIGNENISLGEMNMYYHNLRIRLVKDGNPDSSTFLLRAASFLANTFVIRKNNNGRTGIVYFERMRDRSFFNYIVKMTFSGMATSIGVKKNKKYMKEYRNKLKERNLPPIDFE